MKRIFIKYPHYMLCTIAASLILSGLLLMAGEGSTIETFCPDIFSARRTRIAPLLCLAGYLVLIPTIMLGHRKVTQKSA